jgi:7-keto-8-aminopelargonate synthetase-like enzyme
MLSALRRVVLGHAVDKSAAPAHDTADLDGAFGAADVPARYPSTGLAGSARDFRDVSGPDIFQRVQGYADWQRGRLHNNLWPYSRATFSAPAPTCDIVDEAGQLVSGVNFSSQDYLNLASHPYVKEAAVKAIYDHGVHSAGSSILLGNTKYSLDLEEALADFLEYTHTTLFPTGWAAGYGVIKGLIRPNDHIILDGLAHACLQEGAQAATPNVHVCTHLNNKHVLRTLRKIRANDTENAILVVTESLFSMDSDTPDLAELQELCREYRATLLVDCAHDLGCIGEDGRGHIGLQKLAGKIDIVMGSFSKTFASNGGFVCANASHLRQYLKAFAGPNTFSNALSPVQAAVVLRAVEIIRSSEGRQLRRSLMDTTNYLRSKLVQHGFPPGGEPSAIVPVPLGDESFARLVSSRLPGRGVIANLVEFPAVAKGSARLRLQVMAKHTHRHVDRFVDGFEGAVNEARLLQQRETVANDAEAPQPELEDAGELAAFPAPRN